MEKDISRREFIGMMGVGAATIALGNSLTGCNSNTNQIAYGAEIGYEDLANYFYVEYPTDIEEETSFLVVREKKVEASKYYYYSLILNERTDRFYAEKIGELDLKEYEKDKEHIPMEAFCEYYDTISCEPIIDVFNEELGVKPQYKAGDYRYVLRIVEENLENKRENTKVKSL